MDIVFRIEIKDEKEGKRTLHRKVENVLHVPRIGETVDDEYLPRARVKIVNLFWAHDNNEQKVVIELEPVEGDIEHIARDNIWE